MKKISAKSNMRIQRLLSPPTEQTGLDHLAPRGLTVRRLICHQKHKALREKYTMARTVDGHLLSIGSLISLGWALA